MERRLHCLRLIFNADSTHGSFMGADFINRILDDILKFAGLMGCVVEISLAGRSVSRSSELFILSRVHFIYHVVVFLINIRL